MGGLKHNKMAMDPAIIRLANTITNRHHYFRWTPRNARIAFTYVVVVPSIFYYFTAKTDGLWNLRGKLRGDLVSER